MLEITWSPEEKKFFSDEINVFKMMRSSAEGDKVENIIQDRKASVKAVQKTISFLEDYSDYEDYLPIYRNYLRTKNILKSLESITYQENPWKHVINARIDHFFIGDGWCFLGDFNNKAQGWSALPMDSLRDHGMSLFYLLYLNYMREHGKKPENVAVVHGRPRDALGYESVFLGIMAVKTRLFSRVKVFKEAVEYNRGDDNILINGQPFDIVAVFGGKVPHGDGNVFPNKKCARLCGSKPELMLSLKRFIKKTGFPIRLPLFRITDHRSFVSDAIDFFKKTGVKIAVVKNGGVGSGKGVYFLIDCEDTIELVRNFYHLCQMISYPDKITNTTFKSYVIAECITSGLVKTDYPRISDLTPRMTAGITYGSVGRLAKSPYSDDIYKKFYNFFLELKKIRDEINSLYYEVVDENGKTVENFQETVFSNNNRKLIEQLKILSIKYELIKGIYVVSGARLNEDGSQVVDISRTYTAFTSKHRNAIYMRNRDIMKLMTELYFHSNIIAVAVNEISSKYWHRDAV